jgi:hypothetical protein
MNPPDSQPADSELLQSVLMRAAANRAAMISRHETTRLVRDIKQQQDTSKR